MKYLLSICLILRIPLILLNCKPPEELTKKVDAQAEEISALKEKLNTVTSDLEALKTAFEEHMTKFHPKATKTVPERKSVPAPPKPPVKKKQVEG